MANQRSRLVFGFFLAFLLACVAGVLSIVLLVQDANAGNCATGGTTFMSSANSSSIVQDYLAALKNKDYNKACSYFDPKSTIHVGKIDQPVSATLLQKLDAQKGKLGSYRIIDTLSGPGNMVIIAVDVMRGSRNLQYKLHITLQQEVGGWKITYVDSL